MATKGSQWMRVDMDGHCLGLLCTCKDVDTAPFCCTDERIKVQSSEHIQVPG